MGRAFRRVPFFTATLGALAAMMTLSPSATQLVHAASSDCQCANGGTPSESLIAASADPTNNCICDCVSSYLPPLCDFTSSDQVKVLVLWHNTTAHPFTTVEKRTSLQTGLTGSTRSDLLPVTIMENLIPSDLESVVTDATATDMAGENVVPFLYVITGTYASKLLLDSLKTSASMPSYLSTELCLGAREVGNKPSPPSKYATALAKSKPIVSTELSVSFTITSGTSSRVGAFTTILEITQNDVQYFIANIVIVIAVAILGAVEHCVAHPKSEDGDELMVGYGGAAKATGDGLGAAAVEDTFQPMKEKKTIEFGAAPKDGEVMATAINYHGGSQVVVIGSTTTTTTTNGPQQQNAQGPHPFASTDFGLNNTAAAGGANYSPREAGAGLPPPHASTPSPQFNHAGALAAADGFGDGGFGLAAGGGTTAIEMTALPGQQVEADVAGWYPAGTNVTPGAL